jgi:hypothetical protein
VPGRRDPYDDLLQDSYGSPKWMNALTQGLLFQVLLGLN